jgi:hypothetical protein
MSPSHDLKTFEEAQKQHEHAAQSGIHAPRWIPIAISLLALLAAATGLLANLRVTQSSATKSDAIILTTRAADTYSEYEARSVKEHIYAAALDATTDPKHAAHLRTIAEHENQAKAPLLVKARKLDEESRTATLRAEHILVSHEILEVATTLFEISIVLVSVTALLATRLLPIAAAAATAVGLAIALRGFFY